MEIDTEVLEKLQSGGLSDEKKHEIIYDILKGHIERNGGNISSNSPSNERDGQMPQKKVLTSNLLKKKRVTPQNEEHYRSIKYMSDDLLEDEVRAFQNKRKSRSPSSSKERKLE